MTSDGTRIALAETVGEIARCYGVRDARTADASCDAGGIHRAVQREQKEGYRLAFLEANGAVRATAGCRIIDLLFSGRTLCVNDLVTHEGTRSLGFGGRSSIGSSRKRDARSVSTREA